jgi:hypothetical protein
MNWLQKNLNKIVYIAFLVPIITVAFVSISHVTTWYSLTNTSKWSLYLSFGIEIAALSALAAISVSMGRKVYLPFGIVTLIQLVGNVFYSYTYIDENSKMFKDWVELSNVFFQYIIEDGDIVGHKRILALFSGGLLPIISLSFLHLLVKLQETENDKVENDFKDLSEDDIETISKQVGKLEFSTPSNPNDANKITPTQEELDKLEEYLDTLTKNKLSQNNNEVPKPTKRPYKPRVTPTLLEDTLLNEDNVDKPKAKTSRRKKMDLNLGDLNNDIEADVKKLVYRKRDNGDN